MNFKFIESDQELSQVCAGLALENIIAVDLEADSLHSFKEKICLVQIASLDQAYLIDPFVITAWDPFVKVLESPSVAKVFHGSDFDVRSLDRELGVQMKNLFDTEIACRFLNVKERGLAPLLKAHFNIHVDKRFQRQDWSRRPLSPEMIAYSVGDVAHLIALYDILKTKLEKIGRLSWAREEFELQAQVRYECNHQPPFFKKFKGAGKLDNRSLAILENLLELRLKVAEKKDVPPFKIMSNQSILALTHLKPQNVEQMVAQKVLSKKQASMYGDQCRKAVSRALALAHRELPAYPKTVSKRKTPAVQQRIGKLKAMREKQSTSLGMEPGFLINNALITRLAFDPPGSLESLDAVSGLRNWQKHALGQEILNAIN